MQLTFGATVTFFLTLQELVTLASPSYLFVFEQRVTKATVAVVLTPEESTERADKFSLDVDAVFAGCDPGQWGYTVYQQSGPDNTDPANTVSVLERGIMQLYPAAAFAFTQPETTTTFYQPA